MTVSNNDVMGICLHFFPFAGRRGGCRNLGIYMHMKNLKAVQMAGVGTVTLKQEHIVF